jgi:hypothetical protein
MTRSAQPASRRPAERAAVRDVFTVRRAMLQTIALIDHWLSQHTGTDAAWVTQDLLAVRWALAHGEGIIAAEFSHPDESGRLGEIRAALQRFEAEHGPDDRRRAALANLSELLGDDDSAGAFAPVIVVGRDVTTH